VRRGPVSFGPLDASFISGSAGWMLGLALTGRQRLELYKTVDGGRRWAALPAPPASWRWHQGTAQPNGVSGVTFADARNGWLYGPGLWASHDGGMTWRRLAVHGAQVDSVQADGGRVLAAFTVCPGQCRSGRARFAVYRPAAGRDDWRPVAGAAGLGFGRVTLTGPDGYASGAQTYGSGTGLVAGPVSAPSRWQHRPVPCGHAYFPAAIAASQAGLVLACNQPPGAHPVQVREYRSADGGRNWHQLTPLSLQDGASMVTITAAGMIIISGMYNGLLISRDNGRAWHTVPEVDNTDAVGGGSLITAAMTGNRLGFAIAQTSRAWLTPDGGRTWNPVSIP
jgi:hypothetical protein